MVWKRSPNIIIFTKGLPSTLKRRVDSKLWKLPWWYQIQSSVLEVLMLWILRKEDYASLNQQEHTLYGSTKISISASPTASAMWGIATCTCAYIESWYELLILPHYVTCSQVSASVYHGEGYAVLLYFACNLLLQTLWVLVASQGKDGNNLNILMDGSGSYVAGVVYNKRMHYWYWTNEMSGSCPCEGNGHFHGLWEWEFA